MDLAVCFPTFDSLGGAQKCAAKLMQRWSKHHEITLYSLKTSKQLLKEFDLDIQTAEIKTKIPGWKTNSLSLLLALKKMTSSLGRHDLYINNMFPTHAVDRHPNIWLPQEPSRILYDLSETISTPLKHVYFPILKTLDKRFFAQDKVFANSLFAKKYLDEVYGVDSEVCYLGVDPVEEPRFSGDYVLCVSRLVKEKRVDLAIKALKFLPDLKLKVAGGGPELEKLKTIAPSNVEFLGHVAENDLPELYKNAMCTVFTPLREPFGLIALESMAAGTPVIGGLEGGYTEVYEDGVEGFKVEPVVDKIAEKIKLLSEDKSMLESFGKGCVAKSKNFSWDRTADTISGSFLT